MVSTADLLLILELQDNASSQLTQIQNTASQAGEGMQSSMGGVRGTMRELSGIFSGLNGLVMGAFGAYGLSTFKNMTYGMATAREEVKGLFNSTVAMTEGLTALEQVKGKTLWDYMDEMTDKGYVQLDDLTQAVNVFKMSTNAGAEEVWRASEVINMIGNRAIQMGKDSNQVNLLMMGVAKGVNGSYQMLNNTFGVTKGQLEKMGWSGQKDDVLGYLEALNKYVNSSGDLGDLLDSTQGRVVSLQKRFRVAGREIGNAMLPVMNNLMDIFTQLNAQSDDVLAKTIILSTGIMSGFSSILPTLSPLIQIYDFLDVRLKRMGKTVDENGKVIRKSSGAFATLRRGISGLWSPIRTVKDFLYEWIAYPVFNYLSIHIQSLGSRFLELAKIPFNTVFDKLSASFSGFMKLNPIMRLRGVGASIKSFTFSNIGKGMEKALVPLMGRYSNFISLYGKEITQLKWLNTVSNAYKKTVEAGLIPLDSALAGKLAMYKANLREAISNRIVANAQENETSKRILMSAWTQYGTGVTDVDTVSNYANATSTDAETASKNRGIIATKLHTAWTKIRTAVTNALNKVLKVTIGLEGLSMWYVLLIIGVIVAVILVVKELGKQLGWWESWGEMLDAIHKGLIRLWSAFINNPNVQAFIKDLQGLFSGTGNVIGWVASEILKLFGIEDNGEQVDAVRMIIDTFGALGKILGDIVNIFKFVFGAIYTVIAPIIGAIVGVIKTIYCIIWGCSPGVIPALRRLYEIFTQIFGGIVSFITNPVGFIVGQFKQLISGAMQIGDMIGGFLIDRFNKFLDFLGPLGTAIRNVFNGALPVLANIVQKIANTIGQVFGVFSGMLTGKIGVEEGLNRLSQIILPLLTRIYQIFVGIFNRIRTYIIKTAMSMVNGFIGYILSIPRRVMSIFTNLLNMLFNLPSQLWNTGKQMGQDIYNGIDSAVSGVTGGLIHLPGNTNGQQGQARANARTVGNVNKNYNNARRNTGHTINVGAGAIQLDARNLTTKESRQVMINALEGLTSIARTKATNPKK